MSRKNRSMQEFYGMPVEHRMHCASSAKRIAKRLHHVNNWLGWAVLLILLWGIWSPSVWKLQTFATVLLAFYLCSCAEERADEFATEVVKEEYGQPRA